MLLCSPSLICVMLVLFTTNAVNGYYGHQYYQCYYSEDLNTVEFIYSWYFNQAEQLRYNSTSDTYTGFSELGITMAESLKQNPSNNLSFLVGDICTDNRDKYASYFQETVTPEVTLTSLRCHTAILPTVLLCTAYDYYPKGVTVFWLRDGELITEGVSSTDELSDGDWYYQIHSYLEFISRPGENISCVVEHISLTEPIVCEWDTQLPVDEKNKLIIGIFLLVLGIALAIAGFLYYMLRSKECPAIQTSQSISLERTVSEAHSEASSEASSEGSNPQNAAKILLK